MNPYLEFVDGIDANLAWAKRIASVVERKMQPVHATSRAVLFSPHPDDECVTGLLPLRLMQEVGMQIINVPVTFGSRPERQAARSRELENACAYLGWNIHLVNADLQPLSIDDVVQILKDLQPEVIFMPHDDDWNSRHLITHDLVFQALKQMDRSFECKVVETEFWKPMHAPNLMVEADTNLVAELVAATSLHIGEIERNPYHLRLPAWMQDNVRRGSEIVGGQGGCAPDFAFATLYRLRRWEQGHLVDCLKDGLTVSLANEQIKEVF
ncbi:PIG-L deacetylase family protein [Coraliomargarita akajimensis]|uniref:LmbE family protein n=1 Tax=Coraliomargarita akajimensis (strain DSM 45221 / IAM 15411 / JCM 23193 / KCTC 12865 / 04OKA010-24) TaxID=583355 RepID=D5ENQ8_CORAD|nr:PIG-L family deacetylase [Coraliomargarita akajimensis]ADE53567.1 LmbE family protein [Coraliomargarita akajimensis DSM 45221]